MNGAKMRCWLQSALQVFEPGAFCLEVAFHLGLIVGRAPVFGRLARHQDLFGSIQPPFPMVPPEPSPRLTDAGCGHALGLLGQSR